MKLVYWLCKEVAHTSKYESLIDLPINLGCTYLGELNVSARANHRSRQIVGEFIEILSSIIERYHSKNESKSIFLMNQQMWLF